MASEAKPYSKAEQLGRGERRYRRKVASPKQWQALVGEKVGPCRVCGSYHWPLSNPLDLHHLVARVHGGDDVAANLVPVCRRCHEHITRRVGGPCRALLESLDDFEYGYMIRRGGPDYPQRAYGVEYVR